MTKRNYSDAEIERRRQHKMTHGAHSYLARTDGDAAITVSMAEVERSVLAEVETDGPRERVRKQAIRFGTAAELLWGYMQSAPDAFEAGLSKWGWLAGAEIRAWRDWQAMKSKGDDGPTAAEILEQYRGKNNR